MAPEDTFFDDEDDTCPLCIEEFDLSDRNFRPCPCGYQICQFCFNNLKNNLSGLCPACRRPYDEKDVKWKVVTREEEAEFRANIQKNQKKRASEQRQKEAQKREAEKENRKNLQGVRVVQKNLVYVTGLTPTVREDELLKTLRKPEFFGQYGNIQKISISNRKSSDGQQQSLGIYVTFEKKEDAAKCIAAVNGSQNGDRILKAQLGTTKYCSAWLRHEQCGNRQCMFLHELGDEEDSYSRQDLSSLNSVHTQRPLSNAASSSRSVSRPHPPTVPAPATSQPMIRSSSKEDSEAGDGPALPASANWARTTQQRSRRGSHATSGAASSPAISTSLPATTESGHETNDPPMIPEPSRKLDKQRASSPVKSDPATVETQPSTIPDHLDFGYFFRVLASCPAQPFTTQRDPGDECPPMFDLNGVARRRAMRDEDENRLGDQDDQVDNLTQSDGELESGSLALGGEPEDRDQARNGLSYDQRRSAPIQRGAANDLFGPTLPGFGPSPTTVGSIGSRTMTPQQQLFLRPQSSFTDQMPPGIAPQQTSQQTSLFQGQGHTRQQSRFSFANENNASSINVKSSGDPRYMAQQSSMMPSTFRSQPGGQLYTTSVSGPPPGLKSTGTPPVGGMFGQGHTFGGAAFGAASKANPNDLLQSLIRGNVGSQAHDGKHDDLLPLDEASSAVDALVSDSYPSEPQGPLRLGSAFSPFLPPGLGFSHAHPVMLFGGGVERAQSPESQDRPYSRSSAVYPLPIATPRTPQPVTPLTSKSFIKPVPPRGKEESSVSNNDVKKNIKELAGSSGLSQDIAAQASESKATLLQEEDFPALDSVKAASPSKAAITSAKLSQAPKTPSNKKVIVDVSAKTPLENKSKKSDKRPVPGILDIAAATHPVSQHSVAKKAESQDKSANHISANAQSSKTPVASALPTPTPTTASLSSPLAKGAPKTLRLVQTPKAELPTTNIAPAAVASIRSAAAASFAHRPMTPASEIVSDTASIISASVSASRTSSPPPSKIGSLPARPTTKSQQRKQRKEASKEAAAQIAETNPFEPEVEIAPILGRKKKQKREKRPAGTSRASTRPVTPSTSEPVDEKDKAAPETDGASHRNGIVTRRDSRTSQLITESSNLAKEKGKTSISSPKSPVALDTSIRLNESTKTTVLTPDYISHTPEVKNEQPIEQDIGQIPHLRDVFQSLVQEGALPKIGDISFFKSPPTHRLDSNANGPVSLPPTLKAIVAKEDEEKLNAFQPVRKTVNDHTVLLTPNGDCLLNLTLREADLFLELQDRLRADSIRPTAFSAPRYAPASGFSLVKNRAVPNGTPSFFPLGPDNYPSDPVGKMHREEAISCINQHVLPSLNLGSCKTMGASSNFTKNVNLQQFAPWIYPPTDNPEDQRKMFPGRAADEYGTSAGGNSADVYGNYDHPENGPSPAIGSTPLMSVEDAETVWAQAKKQHEALDKKFRQLQAKNRRLLLDTH
ncbi:putative CCR4-NOT transcription complex subunit 4 [Rosellinia necatrix]|uniref:Putative CCR4-NOT transcription complex subunit 4 n=1 Tax=Rosellinia necatrix TaxID=77044 RepID=A0A1W2TJD3_ROSNE|nr:putative CCR4-NOT transcription complex subunit 4 [Rosellinia necatrix]